MTLENLCTVRQYATQHSLSLSTVTSWVTRGQLPTVVIAGRTFVMKTAQPTHSPRVQVSKAGQP